MRKEVGAKKSWQKRRPTLQLHLGKLSLGCFMSLLQAIKKLWVLLEYSIFKSAFRPSFYSKPVKVETNCDVQIIKNTL